MKHTLITTVLMSLYLVSSSQAVYAADMCEAQFATRESKNVSVKTKAEKKADKAEANMKAARDLFKTGSVKPSDLQDVALKGQPESKGIVREAITWLKGVFKPVMERETKIGTIFRPSGTPQVYGGRKYIEFPNSTMMTTEDAEGNTRVWVLTRGVRSYKDMVNRENGEINPRGYVSDVLLFEMVEGKPVFQSIFLESAPEKNFKFEDPRISVHAGDDGRPRYFLSGTDYSPHVGLEHNPKQEPDVMNRYVELEIDKDGRPLEPKVDPDTKLPEFKDISPAPFMADGEYVKIDAKNATISRNSRGETVVIARLRPDFKQKFIKRLFGEDKWDYAEQVFIFAPGDFEKYDMRDLMTDLAGKAGVVETFGSVRPRVAKELIRDTELVEHLKVPKRLRDRLKIIPGIKGMGPGTRPMMLQRVGDLILVSDGAGLPQYVHAVLSHEERATFPMKDGEIVNVKLDHEIRKLKQKTLTGWFKRRHYTATMKVMNERMDEMTDYLPDVVQPKDAYELGLDSGILDLLHVYPMGLGIVPAGAKMRKVDVNALAALGRLQARASSSGEARTAYESALNEFVSAHGLAKVLSTAGISDAHTSIWGVNWKVLVTEARSFTKAKQGQNDNVEQAHKREKSGKKSGVKRTRK